MGGDGGRVIVTVDYLRPTRRGLSKHPNTIELARGRKHTCPLRSRVPCLLQLKCGVHRLRLEICSVALQPSLAVNLLVSSTCEEDISVYTDMRRLTTALRSVKCVVRRFRPCANLYLTQTQTVQYSLLHT